MFVGISPGFGDYSAYQQKKNPFNNCIKETKIKIGKFAFKTDKGPSCLVEKLLIVRKKKHAHLRESLKIQTFIIINDA